MEVLNLNKNGENTPIKVFKNDKGKYSIAISKKVNDKYENKYFPVEFMKDVQLENGEEIIIKHAFLTYFDWNFDDKSGTKWLIKITAFEKVKDNFEVTPHNIDKWTSGKDIKVDEDELPFF